MYSVQRRTREKLIGRLRFISDWNSRSIKIGNFQILPAASVEIAYRHRKGRDDIAESVAKLLNIVNIDRRGDKSFEGHYQRTSNCCFQKKITRFTYTSFERCQRNLDSSRQRLKKEEKYQEEDGRSLKFSRRTSPRILFLKNEDNYISIIFGHPWQFDQKVDIFLIFSKLSSKNVSLPLILCFLS